MNGVICLILVIVAVAMILLGAWMIYRDWRNRPAPGEPTVKPDSVSENITALTKLIEALKGTSPGQWLVVLGVVILFVAILFCGLDGIAGGNHSSNHS